MNMDLELIIRQGIQQGFKELFNAEPDLETITLQPTKKEFEGTFTFVTFPYSKITKKSPEEAGRLLGEYLTASISQVSGFNVVKGFLNLSVSDRAWLDLFRETILAPGFASFAPQGQKVMVEYSSPNTNKPLHLGHLRNNFLGYSVAGILKANGYEVIKANLINDRGIHICKSMLAYQKYGNGETPGSSGMKGDHLIGKYYVRFSKELDQQVGSILDRWSYQTIDIPSEEQRREAENLIAAMKTTDKEKDPEKYKGIRSKLKDLAEDHAPILKEAQQMLKQWEEGNAEVMELWKKMNGWVYEGFEATYKAIGVDFDKYYYESDTYLLGKAVVEEGLQKGIFFKKPDGSVWVDLTSDGLDQKLLLRGDGTSVYITQDLGTADLKYKNFHTDKSIYVVGNEQDYHFTVLRLILKKLGRPYADGVYHLSYGMVDLPSGKMKSREGTVVDADELIDEMVTTAKEHTTALGKIEGFTEKEAMELYKILGLGALKYFLLKVDPKKRMLFNPNESIEFQGNTGPFIQYTHARISAILRKAAERGIEYTPGAFSGHASLQPSEKEVIVLLSQYPAKIAEAAREYSPAIIAQYVFDLAKEYNRFYADVSIFNEADSQALAFRVAFSSAVASVIRRGMKLLGIEVPERM